jgi:hypothetical protein
MYTYFYKWSYTGPDSRPENVCIYHCRWSSFCIYKYPYDNIRSTYYHLNKAFVDSVHTSSNPVIPVVDVLAKPFFPLVKKFRP